VAPPAPKRAASPRRGRQLAEAAGADAEPPPRPSSSPILASRQRGAAALPEVARNTMQVRQAEAAAQPSVLDALFAGTNNGSPWVATTERFADSVQLRYQELARDELLPQALCVQHASVADDTLAQLRSAVADLAQRRGTT
jgi:hypothetical protein